MTTGSATSSSLSRGCSSAGGGRAATRRSPAVGTVTTAGCVSESLKWLHDRAHLPRGDRVLAFYGPPVLHLWATVGRRPRERGLRWLALAPLVHLALVRGPRCPTGLTRGLAPSLVALVRSRRSTRLRHRSSRLACSGPFRGPPPALLLRRTHEALWRKATFEPQNWRSSSASRRALAVLALWKAIRAAWNFSVASMSFSAEVMPLANHKPVEVSTTNP